MAHFYQMPQTDNALTRDTITNDDAGNIICNKNYTVVGLLILTNVPSAPNNTAALAKGLPVGAIYTKPTDPDGLCIVH